MLGWFLTPPPPSPLLDKEGSLSAGVVLISLAPSLIRRGIECWGGTQLLLHVDSLLLQDFKNIIFVSLPNFVIFGLQMLVSTLQIPISVLQIVISELQTITAKLQIVISGLQTPTAKLQIVISGLQTPTAKLQIVISGLQTITAKLQIVISEMQTITAKRKYKM